MELISSTTAAGVASNLGANVAAAFDNVFTVALVAIAIPVTFYVIRRLAGLFPGTSK